MDAIITRPKSKYALKRQKRLEERFVEEVKTSEEAKPKEKTPLVETVKEVLYSREGAIAFHRGNPFAIAFNKAINEG